MSPADFRTAAARWFRDVRAVQQRAGEIDYVAVYVAACRAARGPACERVRTYRDELRFLREQCPPLAAAKEEAAADRLIGRRTVAT